MDRNLALEGVRITEAAALASARLMGRGDHHGADQAATEAMRGAFNDLDVAGEVVIGEGERDEAPMLYIGERVGRAGPGATEIEIAVDPLEGTNLCATGAANAISVIAMGPKGSLLRAPDTYMEKIAVGPAARGVVDLSRPVKDNLRAVADALGRYVEDVTVVILDRPRHDRLIRDVREAGARIRLISDGDVSAAINTCLPDTGIDMLVGIGGAPEGVISAAALRCMGGDMQGKLRYRNDAERERARAMGIDDGEKIFRIDEMARGDVMFASTGVTNGDFLKGVRFTGDGARTHSVVMRSRTGTVRYIETEHHFQHKPNYGW
ncbi:MAG TPA: class II fructose-bisphosphatase [Anaeromyxobacteraceae bacterium]|nr:class II fructose-bisphosphatase [Anaeromyxobacteraceae bacterium]